MIDRTKVWAGEMNARATVAAPAAPTRVGLYDTTLRDGEQTVGVVLDPERKLAIARELDALGIGRIEAGFPRVSEADHEAFQAIMAAGLSAEVWGFSRAMPADLEALAELGVRAAVIEAPISDGKLAAYGLTREKVQQRVETAIRAAGEAKIRVAFFGVDGSRAAPDFLQRIYGAAVEAGAVEVVAVDTIGVATPETAAHFVNALRGWVGEQIPVHWHGHDDFGLATACSLAAVRAGATWVQGTINGMGERGGNADLVEIGMALEALYGIDSGLDFRRARRTSAFVREASGYQLEPWKAIVGENLFTRETGAVASQFHDPPAIEPYSAELLGAQRRIVLGKKSGVDSIRIKLSELGLDAGTEDQQRALLAAVKELGTRERRLVSDGELRELAQRELGDSG
ncbi:MAG: LeuA family protein [Solirubrobacteraceae bacterium]